MLADAIDASDGGSLLPTPRCPRGRVGRRGASHSMSIAGAGGIGEPVGSSRSLPPLDVLATAAFRPSRSRHLTLLPTPTARDHRGAAISALRDVDLLPTPRHRTPTVPALTGPEAPICSRR